MRITRITMGIMLIVALLTIACAPAPETSPASTQVPATPPTPTAGFTTSDLTITPNTVKPGEPAEVGVTVTNNGGGQGTYKVVVKLHDGTFVGTQDVTLAGGARQNVTLDISLNSTGTHMIMIDKLNRNLVVQAAEAPAPTQPPSIPPALAAGPATFTSGNFVLSNLEIAPELPKVGEIVTVSVKVTNTGGQQGTYPLVLKINGVTAEAQDVTLAGGASQTVNLIINAGMTGTFTITIDKLTAELVVMACE